MKILYASHAARDPLKGAPWADISLIDALRRRGHEVEEVWDFASPRSIRHDNLHLLLEAPRRCEQVVLSQLAEREFDVVLVNQPLGWRAGRAIRREHPGCLYIARSHGWEPRVHRELASNGASDARSPFRRTASRVLRPILDRQNQRVLDVASGVVVCSVDDARWIADEEGFPEEKILALPPGIAGEFLSSPAVPMDLSRLRRLLYVGQYAPFKAPKIAAEAISGVMETMPETSATWVCASAHHEAVRSLFAPRLRGRVKLLDWMPRAELAKVYDESGIYVFPSYFEGFAQSFLEAMARGVVVLASRIDGMRQAIREGENGFLFGRDAAEEIAKRALWLIENPERAMEISVEARRTAETYTWESAAERFERFVEELRSEGATRKLVERPQDRPARNRSLSIAIPTYGRESILLDTVRHVLSLPDRAEEVLVLDQTPVHDEETEKQLREWDESGRVRWICLPEPSIPGSMNEALRRARGEIVLFLDDDLIPEPGLVDAHRRAHEAAGVGAVTGTVLQPGQSVESCGGNVKRGRGLRRDLEFSFNSSGFASVFNVMAGNLSVKRVAALAAGGFDERFVRVAYRFETEFCRRLRRTGADVRYEPRAVVHHLKASSGGTRAWGDHQSSAGPEHSVGDYYFALVEGKGAERWSYVTRRFVRECLSRYLRRHPWRIPAKALGEARGFAWALRLARERKAPA